MRSLTRIHWMKTRSVALLCFALLFFPWFDRRVHCSSVAASLASNRAQICDELEDEMSAGGVVLDFHTCDFFPERWFQLVVVLRASNDVLYPRLERR